MRSRIDERLLERCGNYLSSRNLKLVCAESMTGGFLSSMWALELASGDYFLGSVVCYDDLQKQKVLQVAPALIDIHTAESEEVTLAMLHGLKILVPHADVYVSITGLAFESPNPKQQRPVGTVYYAFSFGGNTEVFERHLSGNTGEIIIKTCNSIFSDLCPWIESLKS